MTNDPAAQIAILRRQRDAAADPALRAALDSAIAALEAQFGSAAPPPAGDTLSVGDVTNSQAIAIGAGARATVYIDGRHGKTNDELLAAYYQRLAARCRGMPLQGVYEQRSVADSLAIDLDRVYTELATTAVSRRERFSRAELASFDAEAFLRAHTGDHLLPRALRTMVEPRFPDDPTVDAEGAADASFGDGKKRSFVYREGPSPITGDAHERIARYAKEADELTFLGPTMVTEAIAASPRLVLLGEPGSGKSTALRYLAYTLARAGLDPRIDLAAHLEGWTSGRLLPIFAPLLPLAKRLAEAPERHGEAGDLWDYLVDHLQPRGANAGLAAAVHDEVEAGRAVLLLDGLDEVAGDDSRRKVTHAVWSFAEQYPTCRIVVACRVRAYEGERNAAWQLPGWPTATLADWTLGQMLAFVNAWYHTVAELHGRTEAWRDERIAALRRAITIREDLQRFGRQPLMMTVMALVHLNDGRLPEERASLYGRCIDILLGQWEIAGKEASAYGTLMDYIGLPDADVQSLRPLLGRAAYEAHRAAAPGEVGRLSRAILRTMVDDELKRRKHPNPSAGTDKFLEYTDQRAGLIQASEAGDAYAFPHQTFQEYLAGIELLGGADPLARVLDLRNDDRWRRPILLGVEQLALSSLDVPYRLLSRLVEAPGRAATRRAFDLLLAQEIANDLGWGWLEQRDALFSGLKRRLAQAMAETLRETSVPARDLVRIGAILAELGDPRPGVCDLPPAMVELPGGSFVIGSTAAEAEAAGRALEQYYLQKGDKETAKRARKWPEDEINTRPLTLAPFAIGRYPVTNAQYRRFIEAGGYDPEAPWWDEAARAWLARDDAAIEGMEDWQRRTRKDQPEYWDDETFGSARPNYPVVGISWYEASAFCRWLTQHLNDGHTYLLPSEAEWEYAARGLTRRTYPWGNAELDPERASYDQTYGFTTLAVGCFPRGSTPEGVLDLAGNVWEWTRSEYRDYPYDPHDGREDGAAPAQKSFTLRGGSWAAQPIVLRAACRLQTAPDDHNVSVGFRLARHPPRVKN
ncbi:MAG: SUMF1/EgtB/PvdO family nonheme iron enzyme [Oscillochloridaceae bacterium]|nr:SUMF1/EgtB/PvdO family nonheme iron enzyme [Chloroflexaceae bacterium]MDW8389501.1 SUMF1/EgtB/PvdO family nonheme iron enzyme [Oscillochloridaceae bacterium]